METSLEGPYHEGCEPRALRRPGQRGGGHLISAGRGEVREVGRADQPGGHAGLLRWRSVKDHGGAARGLCAAARASSRVAVARWAERLGAGRAAVKQASACAPPQATETPPAHPESRRGPYPWRGPRDVHGRCGIRERAIRGAGPSRPAARRVQPDGEGWRCWRMTCRPRSAACWLVRGSGSWPPGTRGPRSWPRRSASTRWSWRRCATATRMGACSPAFKQALMAWVAAGHKLIIQDSDDCNARSGL